MHSGVWWILTCFQIGISAVYALYIDLGVFRTYAGLLTTNMTYAEHLIMEKLEKEAENLNIDYSHSLSLYDRQSKIRNMKEMLGQFYYWILPIPKKIHLNISEYRHMVVDLISMKNIRHLITEIELKSIKKDKLKL